MTKLLLLAAAASLAAGGARAQGYDEGYLPAPAYASSGYDYAGAEYGARRGFTLAGVRAGVTVLGLDLDANAALTLGVHDGGYAPRYAPPPPYAPPPRYAPEPQYAPEPPYEPQYMPQYAAPAYGYAMPAPVSYGGYGRSYDVPCGCGR